MEIRRQEANMLLTHEEGISLSLLEPLMARHLDCILETFALQLGSDPSVASLLEDDLALERLKRSQQRYVWSLLKEQPQGMAVRSGTQASPYRDPFGLGVSWHLRTIVHFISALQPLVHDAFEHQGTVHRTVWNALLKVIFRELESVMSAALTQRDQWVDAARLQENEAKQILDSMLNQHAAEEDRRLVWHRKFVEELALWRANVCSLAREMGTPLNIILGHVESLLEKTEDPTVHIALSSILRQVERMILLRQPLCTLDDGIRNERSCSNRPTMSGGGSTADQTYAGDCTIEPRRQEG